VDARKERIGAKDLGPVLKGVKRLVVVKGKKVTTLDLAKEKVPAKELAALLIGPTGNLRAPTLRRGAKMIVGFGAEPLEEFLG